MKFLKIIVLSSIVFNFSGCSSVNVEELEAKLTDNFAKVYSESNNSFVVAFGLSVLPNIKCFSHEIASKEPDLAVKILDNSVPMDGLKSKYPEHGQFLNDASALCFKDMREIEKNIKR